MRCHRKLLKHYLASKVSLVALDDYHWKVHLVWGSSRSRNTKLNDFLKAICNGSRKVEFHSSEMLTIFTNALIKTARRLKQDLTYGNPDRLTFLCTCSCQRKYKFRNFPMFSGLPSSFPSILDLYLNLNETRFRGANTPFLQTVCWPHQLGFQIARIRN